MNNTPNGIPIWNPDKRCAFEGTRVYWEEVKTDYDRIQGMVLKCCAACLRADDLFYDETKIIDKSSGNIIVQVVVDETRNTPVQEIYTHVVAEQILVHNWNVNWKLIWESQYVHKGEGKGGTRRKGKGQKAASDEPARQDYNHQRETERSERNDKWAKKVEEWEQQSKISGKGGGKTKTKEGKQWVYIPS